VTAALGESDVYIWCRSTASLDSDAVKSAEQHLSIEERARRDRLRFDLDRRDFTIAHDLLRRTLSRYSHKSPGEWKFATNEYGKPSIESADPELRALSFSLSHTRGCVACAITLKAPLGIDVEQIDQSRTVQAIAERYFSEKEAAWLRECPDEVRNVCFVELWTLKEAFLKSRGIGLSEVLSDVSFLFDKHARMEVSGRPTIDPNEWHFALCEPLSNVRLGIVTRGVMQPCFFLAQDDGAPTRLLAASSGTRFQTL